MLPWWEDHNKHVRLYVMLYLDENTADAFRKYRSNVGLFGTYTPHVTLFDACVKKDSALHNQFATQTVLQNAVEGATRNFTKHWYLTTNVTILGDEPNRFCVMSLNPGDRITAKQELDAFRTAMLTTLGWSTEGSMTSEDTRWVQYGENGPVIRDYNVPGSDLVAHVSLFNEREVPHEFERKVAQLQRQRQTPIEFSYSVTKKYKVTFGSLGFFVWNVALQALEREITEVEHQLEKQRVEMRRPGRGGGRVGGRVGGRGGGRDGISPAQNTILSSGLKLNAMKLQYARRIALGSLLNLVLQQTSSPPHVDVNSWSVDYEKESDAFRKLLQVFVDSVGT